MRFLIVLAAIVGIGAALSNIDDPSECHNKDLEKFCSGTTFSLVDQTDCDSSMCGFHMVEPDMRKYVTHNVGASYEYLMLASYYGNYGKNRPGFHKQFKDLADKAWSNAIELIKYMSKRGGHMVFDGSTSAPATSKPLTNGNGNGKTLDNATNSYDLEEIHAMGFALDTEKTLAIQANKLHREASHAAHPKHYDAEVAHFIEEEFLEGQTKKIRQLSGWTSDLMGLLKNQADPALSLYLFDEYLQKQ